MTGPSHRIPGRIPNYDLTPFVPAGKREDLAVGVEEVVRRLDQRGARLIVLDAYPGVDVRELEGIARALGPAAIVDARAALKTPAEIAALTKPWVTDDPVFGRIAPLTLEQFFDAERLEALRDEVRRASGRVVVHGVGARLIARGDVLVHADLPRWELQLRQRRGEIGNLGLANEEERASLKYKRAYFVDWRVADRHKVSLWPELAFALDTTCPGTPKLVEAERMFHALEKTTRRPFRVVPLFDPAPWGGQWMKEVCNVGRDQKNLGWCFDCVPEENSLLLGFGDERFELPSLNLVLREPHALLGEAIVKRFGAEFPIRFDFLDTMGGGNLSLQVHPLTGYIQKSFGMTYTQDESYYLLDAGPDATVYLGVKEGVQPEEMIADLRRAQAPGGPSFPDERYVNRFPAKRHDHFLIPAGTVHGAGADAMVLEISATPYIFTFKLWDWNRLGLDGRPRPVHLDHGEKNLQWHRDTRYAREHLINRVTPLGEGKGWRAERTGLHEAGFIETHRHWFTERVPHQALGTVQVLNLVEGEAAIVASPDGAFDPFEVHFAETFIVPAAVGAFTIRPKEPGTACATIKAFIRPDSR